MGFAVAGCAEVSKSRRAGENAFSGVLGGGGESIDLAQSKRNWMRHNECGLWSLGGFCGAHLVLGAGLYQLENLADLSGLPEAGAFLVVAPIKLENGSGGAVRV